MVDMHLEVSIVPVSDADRAKAFYQSLGWRLDDDVAPAAGVRLIQFTPPGSACASDYFHGAPLPKEGRLPGLHPERQSYGSYVSFQDPDDNEWIVQEITGRAPGRG
jgi:catechol 2,3-dioxygenase-like lactoylglutathione lyase family enzyme